MPDPRDPTPVKVVPSEGGKWRVVSAGGDTLDELDSAASARSAADTINESWGKAKRARRGKGAPEITEGIFDRGRHPRGREGQFRDMPGRGSSIPHVSRAGEDPVFQPGHPSMWQGADGLWQVRHGSGEFEPGSHSLEDAEALVKRGPRRLREGAAAFAAMSAARKRAATRAANLDPAGATGASLGLFDPSRHPRSRVGEFARTLKAAEGGEIHLPSGVKVSVHAFHYEVHDRKGGKTKVRDARKAAALALRMDEVGDGRRSAAQVFGAALDEGLGAWLEGKHPRSRVGEFSGKGGVNVKLLRKVRKRPNSTRGVRLPEEDIDRVGAAVAAREQLKRARPGDPEVALHGGFARRHEDGKRFVLRDTNTGKESVHGDLGEMSRQAQKMIGTNRWTRGNRREHGLPSSDPSASAASRARDDGILELERRRHARRAMKEAGMSRLDEVLGRIEDAVEEGIWSRAKHPRDRKGEFAETVKAHTRVIAALGGKRNALARQTLYLSTLPTAERLAVIDVMRRLERDAPDDRDFRK